MLYLFLFAICLADSAFGTPCREGWMYNYVDHQCYKGLRDLKEKYETFEASLRCRLDGGQLAVMKNSASTAFLAAVAGTEEVWIGVMRAPGGSLTNMDETTPLKVTPVPWYEPKTKNWWRCTYANGKDRMFKWSDSQCSCNGKRSAVCTTSAEGSHAFDKCPYGWKYHAASNQCMRAHSKLLAFNEAREVCKAQNADLVMLKNWDITKFIRNNFRKAEYWVGMVWSKSQNNWAFIDGTAIGNYMNWSPYEPNNYSGDEFCVMMYPRYGRWNDNPCNVPHAYVCAMPAK